MEERGTVRERGGGGCSEGGGTCGRGEGEGTLFVVE